MVVRRGNAAACLFFICLLSMHFKFPKLFPNFAHAEIKLLHFKLFGECL